MSPAESIYYHYSYYNQRSNMKLYLVCVILITVFLLDFLNLVQGHGTHDHAHHHDDEEIQRGKQKWFKQPADQHIHDHGHAHGHDHHHDHGHGHHHDHGHDHGHVHSHAHETVHDHKHAYSKPVAKRPRTLTQTIDMWWQAIFATLLISAAPFVILFAVPLESNAAAYQPLLKVLLSFASGGLLGDAFLHLIPHAIHPHSHGEDGGHEHTHDHEHGHDHSSSTTVGLFVLAGIVAFLCIEKVVRLVQGEDHHHHHHVKADNKSDDDKDNEVEDESKDDTLGQGEVRKRISVKSEAAGAENEDQDKPSEEDEKKEEDGSEIDSKEPMKVAGYLNLAADFAHNFTDGLAIGASFLGGQKLGFITTLTILFHEVPHEIGDFAILVQSGCTKKKAMFLQLFTATGALAGCVLGLLAEHVSETTTAWILPFTAGGFIYIATVSVIPELLQDSDIRQTCKEIVAMLTGIVMMVVIAMMEH